ncbi:MAG TPA: adenylate/guanylate cyclase domain-containing protein [Chryseolinea sp.]|nr:adenylate/guanylate cyclase domain-containing protein [Chryseolinea sp.]
MRTKKYYSDVISNLKSEEVKSEFQRSYLLVILFSLIILVAAVNYFTLRDTLIDYYGGTWVFIKGVGFLMVFLVYQVFILQYLKRKLRDGSETPRWYKYVHTMIEITFPSAIIFFMLSELKMISAIDSPVFLLYFLFIILSILHLDFSVSIFAGTFAAIHYAFLTYYAFHRLGVAQVSELATPEVAHYIRSVIMVFSGAAAAFVSSELKNRIKTTFDFQEQKNELELLFGQQVSKEVSKALIEEKGATKRREATVMFLDIRNFTAFADTHTAEEVIHYQNEFLSPVINIINQHQGVVFQILGDGLMACFGSPVENVLHADMAFQASLKILNQVKQSSEDAFIPPTMVGIGLHCGLMVTGNIGNENRKQFSISGTPVIVASRIEQLNKKYGTQLLISEQVYSQIVKGKLPITYIGEEPLRGIGVPVKIYKVF